MLLCGWEVRKQNHAPSNSKSHNGLKLCRDISSHRNRTESKHTTKHFHTGTFFLKLELRPTGTPVRPKNPDYLGLKTQTLPDHSLKNARWVLLSMGVPPSLDRNQIFTIDTSLFWLKWADWDSAGSPLQWEVNIVWFTVIITWLLYAAEAEQNEMLIIHREYTGNTQRKPEGSGALST